VTLKGKQDPSDIFEELEAIKHAYSETAATFGIQDLIGDVFGAALEKYHNVLNVTADIKGDNFDIDDLDKVMMCNLWRQGGGGAFWCLHQPKYFHDPTLNVCQKNGKYQTHTDFKHRLSMQMKPCFPWQANFLNMFHENRKMFSLLISSERSLSFK
jgi:hypothetical protein